MQFISNLFTLCSTADAEYAFYHTLAYFPCIIAGIHSKSLIYITPRDTIYILYYNSYCFTIFRSYYFVPLTSVYFVYFNRCRSMYTNEYEYNMKQMHIYYLLQSSIINDLTTGLRPFNKIIPGKIKVPPKNVKTWYNLNMF